MLVMRKGIVSSFTQDSFREGTRSAVYEHSERVHLGRGRNVLFKWLTLCLRYKKRMEDPFTGDVRHVRVPCEQRQESELASKRKFRCQIRACPNRHNKWRGQRFRGQGTPTVIYVQQAAALSVLKRFLADFLYFSVIPFVAFPVCYSFFPFLQTSLQMSWYNCFSDYILAVIN